MGAHLIGELERRCEGLGDVGTRFPQRLDLVTHIVRQLPEPGAHLGQVKECLLVALAMDLPRHFATRFPPKPQK